MGEVWQAEHVTLKSQVAIKFINPELAASGNGLQRFLREAQACAALKSSHIVQVFDFGVDHEVPYIAMELLKGENLGERLQREHMLTPAATGMILTHVARAMSHAHEVGIVHRDLKPDNVFIVREHGAEIAKVVDFGVAKVTGGGLDSTTGGGTKTGAILGTPFYVSPEQARGNKAVDFRSDLWALGVIVYECLTGQRPFESDGLGDLLLQICGDPHRPPSTVANVPQHFDHWMDRALQKSPDQRFATAQQMAEAFQALLVHEGPGLAPLEPMVGQAATLFQPQAPLQPQTQVVPVAHSTSTTHGLSITTAPGNTAGRSRVRLALAGGVALVAAAVTGAWWATSHSLSALAPRDASAPKPAASAPATRAPNPESPAPASAVAPSAAPVSAPGSASPLGSASPPGSASSAKPGHAAAAPRSRTAKATPTPAPPVASAPVRKAQDPATPPTPARSEGDLFDDRL